MTVGELTEKLHRLDPDLEVVLKEEANQLYPVKYVKRAYMGSKLGGDEVVLLETE